MLYGVYNNIIYVYIHVCMSMNRELGQIANAFGATCTQSIGGVPTESSRYVHCIYVYILNHCMYCIYVHLLCYSPSLKRTLYICVHTQSLHVLYIRTFLMLHVLTKLKSEIKNRALITTFLNVNAKRI